MQKILVSRHLGRINSHLKRGEFIEAEKLYAEILMFFPYNVKATNGLRNLYKKASMSSRTSPPQQIVDNLAGVINEERLELAITLAKNMLIHYPQAIVLWNILGIASAQIDQFDQAIEAFKKIVILKPDEAIALYNLGNVYKDVGQIQYAIESYTKALELKPDYEAAYNNLNIALLNLENDIGKKHMDVIRTYQRLQLSRVESASKFFEVGLIKHKAGALEEAIDAYKKSIEQFPDAAAFNNLGVVLAEKGELEEAIETYVEAIRIKPDYAEAHNNIGNAFKEQGKLEQAIEAYAEAINVKPDYAEAYNNMGNAFKEQGKLELATDAYIKSLEVKPDYTDAARNLVKLPIGNISDKIISKLNDEPSTLISKINDRSEKLFFVANLLAHKGNYEDAFHKYVDANRLKSTQITDITKELAQNYEIVTTRIQNWSPNLKKKCDFSLTKLFILGPSQSGKSSLEQLFLNITNVYPMFENINLGAVDVAYSSGLDHDTLNMKQIFHHNEKDLLDDGVNLLTSTSPESMFYIDWLLDGFTNSFCVLVKRDTTEIASEIFTKEYRSEHFYAYTHSSIQKYLETYAVIWEQVKQKTPQFTLEVLYEDVLTKPKDILEQISTLTGVDFKFENAAKHSFREQVTPFRKYYAQKFKV